VRSTILVVDDDNGVRRVVSLLLELDGHRIFSAHDVPSALAFARDHSGPLHLLVTDVYIPGGNAPALVQGLAELGRTMPVLYLSGYAKPDLGLAVESSCFLTKPFVPADLTEAVLRLLDR
jgi:two-component system, cell cycle sensor histidine kinase and response regulator CckA